MSNRPKVLKADFSVDLEVNRLEEGISAHSIRRAYGKIPFQEDIYQNIVGHTKIVPTEIAIIDHSKATIHNTLFDNVYTPADAEFDTARTIDLSTVFRGNKVPGKFHTIHPNFREEIKRLFSRPNSKGQVRTSREQEMFFSHIYPKLQTSTNQTQGYYQMAVANQRQYVQSAFSKKFTEHTVKQINEDIKESLKTKGGGFKTPLKINSKVIDFDKFEGEVNNYVKMLLNKAKVKGGTVNIGAWGAEFEARRWAEWVAKKADPILAQAYENALRTGTIQYFGLEQGFVDVMYGLAHEDKNLVAGMKIPVRAQTFHEFGWRIGKAPQNYQEFAASVPWGQGFVENISSWYKPISDLGGTQAHRAAIDILKAPEIAQLWDKVQQKAFDLAEADGHTIGLSTSEFIERMAASGDGRKYFHSALEDIMLNDAASTIKNNSKAVKKQLAELTGALSKEAKRRGDYATELISKAATFGGGGGNWSGGGTYGGIKDIPKVLRNLKNIDKKSLWSYGTLGAIAGLTLASTYFMSDDNDPGSGSSFGRSNMGKRAKMGVKRYEEDDSQAPFYNTHFFNEFLPGVATTGGAFALFGLREAQMTGNLLGAHKPLFQKGEGLWQGAHDVGKLIRLGIKAAESNFPVFRVFKLGQGIDHLVGARNFGLMKNGKYKGVRTIIYDKAHPNRVGKNNLDVFMDAIKQADPENAKLLENVIMQDYEQKGLSSVAVNISRTKEGHSIVFVENIGLDGVAKRAKNFEDGIVYKTEPVFATLSTANRKGRNIHPSVRRTSEDFNRIRSSITEDYGTRLQADLGLMTKKTLEQYMYQFDKPGYVQGPLTESIWRFGKSVKWALDLDSKGITESSNRTYNTASSIRSMKNIIGVKGFEGAGLLKTLKMKAQFYGSFGREYLQPANRFLEAPFETFFLNPSTVTRTVNNLKRSASPTKQILGSMLGFVERPHLGLNLNAMKYGLPQYALEFGAKRILPLALGAYGLGLADKILGAATFSPTGRGPIMNGPIKAYEMAMLAYSKTSDLLGLTTVSKRQERYAPGSTGLGIFALPMSMVATYSSVRFLYNSGPQSFRKFGDRFANAVTTGSRSGFNSESLIGKTAEMIGQSGVFKEAIRHEAFRGATSKSIFARVVESFINKPKTSIFAAGMTLMLPFIPGFIGSSKSYNERKAEYKGEKDVAIRKNRGWFLSAQPFVGEKIVQYRHHALNLLSSNWENNGVVWPSYGAKLLHHATLGMANRYILENYHKDAQPTYESAPYGSTVPIFGPLIAQTVGRIVKPIRVLHTQDEDVVMDNHSGIFRRIAAANYKAAHSTDMSVITNSGTALPAPPEDITRTIGFTAQYAKSENAPSAATYQFMRQLNDMVGFKGFLMESTMKMLTGKDRGDEFTPYLQSAKNMYNPSNSMWQYQAGDVSLIGGEFLRRIFVAPDKPWIVNNLPNELNGTSWIPEKFHTGTTFDKMPMGWLYASRKGWEFMYPQVKGMNMEQYPDEVKLDILKYMAPKSREFDEVSQMAIRKALSNKLTPYAEQRAYDAIAQRQELMKTLNAHAENNAYELEMEEADATITGINVNDSTFTVDKYGGKKFKMAGVSTQLPDIRASLLRNEEFDSSEELDYRAKEIQENLINTINDHMTVGNKISMSVPTKGNFSGGRYSEAIVDGLNQKLIDQGSPMVDTGNVSMFNLQQDQMSPGTQTLGKYWNALTDHNSFFMKKMIGNRDYLTEYKSNRVFNREVKLWTQPIEHFVKPFISSILSNIGIKMTPSFTKRRRSEQQYWDVIKYIKYKTLATHSLYNNNVEEAKYYEQLSKETMIGNNPLEEGGSPQKALPFGERDYFKFFANEPDPKKRAKIEKYLPASAQRIYEAIWVANQVKAGTASEDAIKEYEILKQTGGYSISEDEYKEWQNDTNEEMPLSDYIRARFVREYAKTHDLPSMDWAGFSASVNIENVELLALKEAGEQVQDYGYFDEQIRSSAYDKLAYISSSQMNSRTLTDSQFMGNVLPNLVSTSFLDTSSGMPSTTTNPISTNTISSNAFDKSVYKSHNVPWFALSALDDIFFIGLALTRL